MNKLLDNHTVFAGILGIFIIIVCVLCMPFTVQDNTMLRFLATENYFPEQKWTYLSTNEIITLPHDVYVQAHSTETLVTVLPDYDIDDMSIMFNNNRCEVHAYIDGTEIYSYGSESSTYFKRLLGSIKIIIPLEKSYCGKVLTLSFTPIKKYSGTIPVVYFRPIAQQYEYLMIDNIAYIVVFIIISVLTVMAICLAIIQKMYRAGSNAKLMYNYSIFGISILAWIFTTSDIPQFFTNNTEIISFVNYLSVLYAAVPLMGIFIELLPHHRRVLLANQALGFTLVLINIAGYMLAIFTPTQILLITQIYYLSFAAFMIYSSIKNRNDKNAFTIINICISVFILSGVITLIYASVYKDPVFAGKLLMFSIMAFSIILMVQVITIETKSLHNYKFADIFEDFSLVDSFTKLPNRKALANMNNALKQMPSSTSIIALTVSIRGLNEARVNLGIATEEMYILKTSESLVQAFGQNNNFFRLHKNQFAVLFINPEKNESYYETQLRDTLNKIFETSAYKFKVSIGTAYGLLTVENRDTLLNRVIDRSECNMYKDKIKQRA